MSSKTVVSEKLKSNGKGKVYELDLKNCKLDSLDGIEVASDLRSLDVSFNRIESLDPVGTTCRTLRQLKAYNNVIREVKPLSSCSLLRQLFLQHNNIESLSGLSSLRQLETLYLDYNNIISLKELSGCGSLSTLSVSNNKITSLKTLPSLQSLQELNVEYNMLSRIDNLGTCEQLLEICIDGNSSLKDISGLSDSRTLTTVHASGVGRTAVVTFPTLRSLEELYISNNSISEKDLCGIMGGVRKLDVLDISRNGMRLTVKGVTSLSQLSRLAELKVDGNDVVLETGDVLGEEEVSIYLSTSLRNLKSLNGKEFEKVVKEEPKEKAKIPLMQVNVSQERNGPDISVVPLEELENDYKECKQALEKFNIHVSAIKSGDFSHVNREEPVKLVNKEKKVSSSSDKVTRAKKRMDRETAYEEFEKEIRSQYEEQRRNIEGILAVHSKNIAEISDSRPDSAPERVRSAPGNDTRASSAKGGIRRLQEAREYGMAVNATVDERKVAERRGPPTTKQRRGLRKFRLPRGSKKE